MLNIENPIIKKDLTSEEVARLMPEIRSGDTALFHLKAGELDRTNRRLLVSAAVLNNLDIAFGNDADFAFHPTPKNTLHLILMALICTVNALSADQVSVVRLNRRESLN